MRASAIILMVVFHFIWDLKFFGYISTDIPNGPVWREIRALIVSMFLFAVGVSLVYSYKNNLSIRRLVRRFIKLVIAAVLVSISTMFTTPENWVYFGILHFIALATVLLVWFVNKPLLSLILSIGILACHLTLKIPGNWPFSYFEQQLPSYTVDLVTPIPWLAMPLLGIWAAHQTYFKDENNGFLPTNRTALSLSKNSLIIYLVHQPLLFGIFKLINHFKWLH